MKKILNKIGQVLQVVLAAPVKLPAKAGSILRYIALGLGIVETVIQDDQPPPEKAVQPDPASSLAAERSEDDETE